MKRCEVCGGAMRGGAVYRAKADDGGVLCDLPAQECADCGSLCPDADKIDKIDPRKVPSSVRLRCAQIRAS